MWKNPFEIDYIRCRTFDGSTLLGITWDIPEIAPQTLHFAIAIESLRKYTFSREIFLRTLKRGISRMPKLLKPKKTRISIDFFSTFRKDDWKKKWETVSEIYVKNLHVNETMSTENEKCGIFSVKHLSFILLLF